MNNNVYFDPSLKRWRLRSFLLQLNLDLFTVHRAVDRSTLYAPKTLSNLELMTIVLEDRRFASHCGVDWKSAIREALRALTLRRHGGASTIDMQFVRTCTGYKQRTLGRKIYEAVLARLIQYRYSKRLILRSYLRVAFFGSKLRGARAASMKVFGKSPDDLTIEEAAFLASMLVYPRPLAPTDGWTSRVNRRAEYGVRVYVRHKQRFDQLGI